MLVSRLNVRQFIGSGQATAVPASDDPHLTGILVDREQHEIIARQCSADFIWLEGTLGGQVMPSRHLLKALDHIPNLLEPPTRIKWCLAVNGNIASAWMAADAASVISTV